MRALDIDNFCSIVGIRRRGRARNEYARMWDVKKLLESHTIWQTIWQVFSW